MSAILLLFSGSINDPVYNCPPKNITSYTTHLCCVVSMHNKIIINNFMKIKHVLCGAVDIQNFTLSIQVEWELLMGNTQVTRYLGLLDISENTHSIEYIQLLEALRVHTTMTTYSGCLTTCTVHMCFWFYMYVGTQSLTTTNVVIDGYTVNSTINSPATLPLGTTVILVCRLSGIPHGLQTNYHWTCPNGPCQQKGYAGRKINNNIIAINITSTSDGGTYTCTVTTEGRKASQQFQLKVTGQWL